MTKVDELPLELKVRGPVWMRNEGAVTCGPSIRQQERRSIERELRHDAGLTSRVISGIGATPEVLGLSESTAYNEWPVARRIDPSQPQTHSREAVIARLLSY